MVSLSASFLNRMLAILYAINSRSIFIFSNLSPYSWTEYRFHLCHYKSFMDSLVVNPRWKQFFHELTFISRCWSWIYSVDPCIPFFKIQADSAVCRSLHPLFAVRWFLLCVDSSITLQKFGPIRPSIDPCIPFWKFRPIRLSVDPCIPFLLCVDSCCALIPASPFKNLDRPSVDPCIPW